MSDQTQVGSADDWHCGGWEGAELTTLRYMVNLTFDQKLKWLKGAQQLIAEIYGWEAALLPSGSTVMPKWYRHGEPDFTR